MKRFLLAFGLTTMAVPALAADVGVSISIAEPGFYGHIDIGDVPRPEVVYGQPLVVAPVPAGVIYQPIYLHVPHDHPRNWRKHCHRYDACGRPVYFVKEGWYNDVYVPHKKGKKGGGRPGNGHGRNKD